MMISCVGHGVLIYAHRLPQIYRRSARFASTREVTVRPDVDVSLLKGPDMKPENQPLVNGLRFPFLDVIPAPCLPAGR